MSSFQLKMLAVVTMLVDHVGAVLFPQIAILRIIGRLSFPIYCFLITEGYLHTSSVQNYMRRLFLFALVSELPYNLAFHQKLFYPGSQNVYFTLLLGLAAIWLIDHYFKRKPISTLAGVAVIVLLAFLIRTDYGAFGVLLIVSFYCCKRYRGADIATFALLNTGYGLLRSTTQLYAAFAGVPIAFYNGKKGKYSLKYFFYAFYPVHLIVLYLLKSFCYTNLS